VVNAADAAAVQCGNEGWNDHVTAIHRQLGGHLSGVVLAAC
jgi:hypothetical protein